jgi:hypothetical protein
MRSLVLLQFFGNLFNTRSDTRRVDRRLKIADHFWKRRDIWRGKCLIQIQFQVHLACSNSITHSNYGLWCLSDNRDKLLSSNFFHGTPGFRGARFGKHYSGEEGIFNKVQINVVISGHNLVLIVQVTAKNGGSMFLQNVGIYLQVHIALQPRRLTTTNPVSVYFCTWSLHSVLSIVSLME